MSKPSRKNKSEKTDQALEESLTIKDGVGELEHEGDGDYVTKEYVCGMMKMQESLFRSLFDSLLTNVNSRIDGVIKDLAELKSSLQFTQKDVDDLKPVTKQMTKIGKELEEVQAQVDFHCDKLEYLENQSRRNNIRIDGIPEEPDETWEDTESKARVALESKLNLPFKVEIERAHRTGKPNRRPDDNASSTLPPLQLCPGLCVVQKW